MLAETLKIKGGSVYRMQPGTPFTAGINAGERGVAA
jgi:hypothetical protein